MTLIQHVIYKGTAMNIWESLYKTIITDNSKKNQG